MKNFMNTKKFTTIAGLLASAALIGCNQIHGEKFVDDSEPNRIGKMAQAQAATGAKEDAMLYEAHFHGSELTSLGQGKLDLIVKGTPAGDPVKVYLNVPHDSVADRQTVVTAYLKKLGASEKNIVIAEGPNSGLTTPTAYNMTQLYKPDGASYNGQAAATDTGSAGGGMAGPASGGGH